MTGNIWEWTSSCCTDYPYNAADGRETPVTPAARRVVRGGSWIEAWAHMRAAFRHRYHPSNRRPLLGLRVAR